MPRPAMASSVARLAPPKPTAYTSADVRSRTAVDTAMASLSPPKDTLCSPSVKRMMMRFGGGDVVRLAARTDSASSIAAEIAVSPAGV